MTDTVTIRYGVEDRLEVLQRTGGAITVNGRAIPHNAWTQLDIIADIDSPTITDRLKAAYEQGKADALAEAEPCETGTDNPAAEDVITHPYPTYIAVQDRGTQAPAPTHRILALMADGTYGNTVAGTWSSRDAVAVCDALNGYPERP